ncbi:MAG: hypothetical protein MZU97_08175 [Bacillus subtilis]|nr:hypothetical protein [Bacillus subtilis]
MKSERRTGAPSGIVSPAPDGTSTAATVAPQAVAASARAASRVREVRTGRSPRCRPGPGRTAPGVPGRRTRRFPRKAPGPRRPGPPSAADPPGPPAPRRTE